MTIPTYRSSRPDTWVSPRPPCDPSLRQHTYGKVQSMDQTRSNRGRLIVIGFAFAVLLYFTDRVASGIIISALGG